jgi:hypothetical protein
MILLCKNGVGDLEYVSTLGVGERLGMAVICGMLDGGEFDWKAMRWRQRA